MKTEQFDALLNEICETRGLQKEDLLEKLGDYLNQNYRSETDQKKREALEEIKRKILTGLYEMANHSLVHKKPDIKTIFNLDAYEMTLVEQAGKELEEARLIEGGQNYSRLTADGVLHVRELYR